MLATQTATVTLGLERIKEPDKDKMLTLLNNVVLNLSTARGAVLTFRTML